METRHTRGLLALKFSVGFKSLVSQFLLCCYQFLLSKLQMQHKYLGFEHLQPPTFVGPLQALDVQQPLPCHCDPAKSVLLILSSLKGMDLSNVTERRQFHLGTLPGHPILLPCSLTRSFLPPFVQLPTPGSPSPLIHWRGGQARRRMSKKPSPSE